MKWYDKIHFPSDDYTLNCTYLPVPPIIVAGKGGGREGAALSKKSPFKSNNPSCGSRLKTNEEPE